MCRLFIRFFGEKNLFFTKQQDSTFENYTCTLRNRWQLTSDKLELCRILVLRKKVYSIENNVGTNRKLSTDSNAPILRLFSVLWIIIELTSMLSVRASKAYERPDTNLVDKQVFKISIEIRNLWQLTW